MHDINSFGFIGGDKRQLYCARSIADDGYEVSLCGFDKCSDMIGLCSCGVSAVTESDALILPLPPSLDGKNINAPFSKEKIPFDDTVIKALSEKPVFCGMKKRLDESISKKCPFLFDYASREEFATANAVPTAEGAIQTAMLEYDGTVNGARCLVAGYGKIGRVLSDMLRGLGAKVTVSARKLRDMEFIRAAGMDFVDTRSISGNYDIIFNTVPEIIFDSHTLAKTASGALVIDLASMPGGIDDTAAERMSIRVIHALSLPGKCAPKAAGIIIKNAVYNIIGEEQL